MVVVGGFAATVLVTVTAPGAVVTVAVDVVVLVVVTVAGYDVQASRELHCLTLAEDCEVKVPSTAR